MDREFTYSESQDLGNGRHRQVIILDGKEIGFLVTREINLFAPLKESYVLPDIDYGNNGMSVPTSGMLEGKHGWIDFKVFVDDYDAAFKYACNNLDRLAYLFEFGDFD